MTYIYIYITGLHMKAEHIFATGGFVPLLCVFFGGEGSGAMGGLGVFFLNFGGTVHARNSANHWRLFVLSLSHDKSNWTQASVYKLKLKDPRTQFFGLHPLYWFQASLGQSTVRCHPNAFPTWLVGNLGDAGHDASRTPFFTRVWSLNL